MRPSRALAALLATAYVGQMPAAQAEVHDSLPDMLSGWVAIQEDPVPPWESAWLRYEAAQSSWLDPTLWAGRTPVQKAAALDITLHEMGSGFVEQMAELATFEHGWGDDLSAVYEGLKREFGAVPLVELYVGYSMSPAKLAIGELEGKPSICLNARRLLPYKPVATRVLLARYLFNWIMVRWPRANPPTVTDRLHQEGMSVWAAGRVLPGVPDEDLLDVTPDQLRQLEDGRARFAAAVLDGLDGHDPEATHQLFGTDVPAGWPRATGAFVGMLVARDMAQELGQAKLPSLSQAEYTVAARRSLARLAAVH